MLLESVNNLGVRMAKQRAIMVSCDGDPDFRRMLKRLSADRGETIAKLVRQAIDAHFQSEFKALMPNFFVDNVASKRHNSAKKHDKRKG